jgi:AraC-like DNA-binding protein
VETIVDAAVGRPAPPLRPFVTRYTGYWLDGLPPGRHQGLPSGHLTVVVSLGPPVDLTVLPDPAQPPASFAALVAGLHASPVTIAYGHSQRGVQLDVTPLGARALFGLPAGVLASTVLGLDDLVGTGAIEWLDRLPAAASWSRRFAIVDDLLERRLRANGDRAAGAMPEVVESWRMLVASSGSVEINRVASEVGWSRRYLAHRFEQEVGLSPKQAARVLRFDRARHMLARRRHDGLAHVAADCGYYDQAHFSREFRQLAGLTPTAWLAEELPSVQDDDVDADAR